MAISNQISRLTTLRNNIRTKLIGLGILPAASTSATLSECYSVLSSVTGLGASSYTPTTTSQVIASGQYLSGAQTINAIPSSYIIPSGTSNITANNVYDITQYASVSVNVQPALQSKTVTPTESIQNVTPDTGIYGLSKVTVNAIPSAYLIPSGTIVLSSSGTFDVASYASADVTVSGGPDGMYIERIEGYNYLRNTPSIIPDFTYTNSGIWLHASELHGVISFKSNAFKNAKIILHSNSVSWRNLSNAIFETAWVRLSTSNSHFILHASELESVGQSALRMAYLYFDEDSFPVCEYFNFDACAQTTRPSVINSYVYVNTSGQTSFPKYNGSVFSLPSCSYIETGAFVEGTNTYSDCHKNWVYAPNVVSIGTAAFVLNRSMTSIFAPSLTYLGGGAFAGCRSLSEVSFSLLTSLRGLTFAFAGSSTTASETNRCSALISVSLPALTLISGSYDFRYCTDLTSVYFPSLSYISGYGTFSDAGLITANFPLLTSIIGGATFYKCSRLTSLNLPLLKNLSGAEIFNSCYTLPECILPVYEYTYPTSSLFSNCSALSIFSAPKTSKLSGVNMFRNCYNLISIFLLGSSVCALGSTIASMFASTPVSNYSTSAGRWASIFVPQSLLATYKAATNWTTISSKIFAYESYFS